MVVLRGSIGSALVLEALSHTQRISDTDQQGNLHNAQNRSYCHKCNDTAAITGQRDVLHNAQDRSYCRLQFFGYSDAWVVLPPANNPTV